MEDKGAGQKEKDAKKERVADRGVGCCADRSWETVRVAVIDPRRSSSQANGSGSGSGSGVKDEASGGEGGEGGEGEGGRGKHRFTSKFIHKLIGCDHCGRHVWQTMGRVMNRQESGYSCANPGCDMFVHRACVIPCLVASSSSSKKCPFKKSNSTGATNGAGDEEGEDEEGEVEKRSATITTMSTRSSGRLESDRKGKKGKRDAPTRTKSEGDFERTVQEAAKRDRKPTSTLWSYFGIWGDDGDEAPEANFIEWQFGSPQLPLEIGMLIFNLLDGSILRRSVSRVCRSWRSIVFASVTRFELPKECKRSARSVRVLQLLKAQCPGLRELVLAGCAEMRAADLEDLPQGKNLAILDMVGLKRVSDLGMQFLPPMLTTLDLSGCSRITDSCLALLPRGLIHLNLRGCTRITGKGFRDLPNLHSLAIDSESQHIASNALTDLPKSLRMLRLPNGIALPNLSRFPELRHVEISFCTKMEARNLPPNLETLSLICPESKQLDNMLRALSQCITLRNLRLWFVSSLPTMDSIPRHIRCLSAVAWLGSIEGLPPRLEYLDIGGMKQVDLWEIPSWVRSVDLSGTPMAAQFVDGSLTLPDSVQRVLIGDSANAVPVGAPCDWNMFPFRGELERTRRTLVYERIGTTCVLKPVALWEETEERTGAKLRIGSDRQKRTVRELTQEDVTKFVN